MEVIELVGAGGILVVTLAIGVVAHELTHLVSLRALGIPCEIDFFPDRGEADGLGIGIFQTWATVVPHTFPSGVAPWELRCAAVAPVVLATPAILVFAGVLPDPVESQNVYLVAATIAWLGCALPSPQDFSLFWHATQVLEEYGNLADG